MARRNRAKRRMRKRFSPEQRKKILEEARELKLTGKQVAEKHGISTVSYYLWRKKAGGRRRRRAATSRGRGGQRGLAAPLRLAVRAKLRKMLPAIVRQELDAIVKTIE
jgi:transposase-like protein